VQGNDDARPLGGVTVGMVGHYDPSYSRNRIVAKALARSGAAVVHVTHRGRFPSRTPCLISGLRRAQPDLVLVAFPGHSDVPAARMASLGRQTPLLFDLFTSLWETALDRRPGTAGRLRRERYRLTDRLACSLATTVLLDTDAHIDWAVSELGIERKRFRRLWVGADDELMRPRRQPRAAGGPFTIFFYGTFIPLHGVEHILRAQRLLEAGGSDVRLVLCGSGQTHGEMRRLAEELQLERTEFLGRRSVDELAELIAESDLCLGIFGTGPKAQRVIPNKVFDALACARAVVTADTPAARECLRHGEDAWLCPPGDPEALAGAIESLVEDAAARERIAAGGYDLFRRCFSLDAMAGDLTGIVLDALGGRAADA
jgi:glycosyltransferase involved in cell wall biosynthesis